MKIRPMGAELFYSDGWTDILVHDEAVSRFSQFCEKHLNEDDLK